jgi:hypothetical protein
MREKLLRKLLHSIIALQEKIISFLEKGTNEKNKKENANIEKVPLSGEAVDLDALLEQEREIHITFYDTENAQIAKGAQKAPAHGIDKFDEKDTFDPDEASDYQTSRDRYQNSDLSKRFYSGGLDIDLEGKRD